MEVHHHTHATSHQRKWTQYLWEFLMLFLAVFCGFMAENLREHIKHNKEVKINMRSLLSDLQSDINYFDATIDRNAYSVALSDSLIEQLHTDINNTAAIYYFARATTANLSYFYSNSKSFDQMKSAGLLRFIKNRSLLDSLGSYYVSFQWLAAQSELLRLKADAIHKENKLLFDSYIFNQMMVTDYRTGTRVFINKVIGNPPLLSTDPGDINAVSINYHYYATTAKFYNRTATIQKERAKRIVEMIKDEYEFR